MKLSVVFLGVVAARNYLVNQAVSAGVETLASARKTNVVEGLASSIASHAIGDYVDQPPISAFLDKAIDYAERRLVAGGQLTDIPKSDIASLAGEYATAWTQVQAASDFSSLQHFIRRNVNSFNATQLENRISPSQMSQAKAMIHDLQNDPQGKQAVSIGSRVYEETNSVFDLKLPSFHDLLLTLF